MKKISIILAALFVSLASFAQTWTVDRGHSRFGFAITHLSITEFNGSFKNYDVKITSAKPDFSDAVVELTADVNSVDTDNEQRDEHLKGEDFFDVAKFNKLSFKSTSITKVSDKKYKLAGDLTLHGVTKPVTLEVVLNGSTTHPMNKKQVAGFKFTGTIKRSDFALGSKYPDNMLSDAVQLVANGEFVKD